MKIPAKGECQSDTATLAIFNKYLLKALKIVEKIRKMPDMMQRTRKWRDIMARVDRRSGSSYFFGRSLPWLVGFLLWSVIFPSPALAFIPHWDPTEAFFIRQFSYLFFMVAMIFFIHELKQEKLQHHRGFRQLSWASVFFALWNLDCFVGQFISLYVQPQMVGGVAGSLSQQMIMTGMGNWINYVTKLDHLLLVPAFIFVYLGLRAFRQEQEAGEL